MKWFLRLLSERGTTALPPDYQTIVVKLERQGLIRFDARTNLPILTLEGQALLDAVGRPKH